MTASVTTRPPASTAAAPWASCSSPTGKRAKVCGCGWGWGAHCSPLGASDTHCVLGSLRKGSDLARLDIAAGAHWLGVCIRGVGTGIIPQHRDWNPSAPCLAPCPWEAYGEEEMGVRSSWRQWHSSCEDRGSCPISLHPIASAAPGEGLDVQRIHTCSGSVRCTGPSGDTAQPGLSTTSHTGDNTPRCCTSHQHPQHLSLPGRAVQAAFSAPQTCPPQGWPVPVLCLLAALRT